MYDNIHNDNFTHCLSETFIISIFASALIFFVFHDKTKFSYSTGLSDIILNVEIKTSITLVLLFKHLLKV